MRCARQILATLAHGAPTAAGRVRADIDRLMEFYQTRPEAAARSNAASRWRSQRILASPKFVFRVERDPAGVAPGTVYRVSDLELASRLSFFLWSSIPGRRTAAVARQGKLKNPAVLDSRCGACWPTRRPRRSSTNSPASGCTCAT